MSNESLNKSQETVNKYLTLAKDDLARLKHILTKFGEYSGLLPEQMGEIEILDRIRESFHSAIRELVADNEAKDRRIAELEKQVAAKAVKVVTMCGSSRFIDTMAVCAWLIEREEHAVTMGLHLLPDWYCTTPDHLAEHEGVADEMDALHLKKIAMSDEIFVVNVNDYIGDSTTREVEFAKSNGIPIRWFTHDTIGTQVNTFIDGILAALQGGKNETD